MILIFNRQGYLWIYQKLTQLSLPDYLDSLYIDIVSPSMYPNSFYGMFEGKSFAIMVCLEKIFLRWNLQTCVSHFKAGFNEPGFIYYATVSVYSCLGLRDSSVISFHMKLVHSISIKNVYVVCHKLEIQLHRTWHRTWFYLSLYLTLSL